MSEEKETDVGFERVKNMFNQVMDKVLENVIKSMLPARAMNMDREDLAYICAIAVDRLSRMSPEEALDKVYAPEEDALDDICASEEMEDEDA